jgi:hypothetical protein
MRKKKQISPQLKQIQQPQFPNKNDIQLWPKLLGVQLIHRIFLATSSLKQ